jgi:hypothetical protein
MADRSTEPRVLELVTVTGVGVVTVGLASPNGPVLGMRGFSTIAGLAAGDTFGYMLEAVDSFGQRTGPFEVGVGTWIGSSQFARTTVIASSNANAAVNFQAGQKYCAITLTQEAFGGSTDVFSYSFNGGL